MDVDGDQMVLSTAVAGLKSLGEEQEFEGVPFLEEGSDQHSKSIDSGTSTPYVNTGPPNGDHALRVKTPPHRSEEQDRRYHRAAQQQPQSTPLPPFEVDIDRSIRERSQPQQQREVARPSRRLVLARPAPFDPITDPFAFVCEFARRPKFGHQYILFPERSRRHRGEGVGLSVGPHWSGVIYTISMIGVITIFMVRYIMNDVAPWCQPLTVVCSLVVDVFLVATAVADPGIVVQSAEGEGCAYCEECLIWTPQDAEHCEEW